ncbi:MAG TPA: SMP-30/gluconolactonase/LRE family protein [Aliidongia sp.]|nr:SMP-30/gluconolactonase/LRE family protein [Aliidongia sp.]
MIADRGRSFAILLLALLAGGPARAEITAREYPLPAGVGAHDVAPAPDGGVWFTAQRQGALGRLDPATGHVDLLPLGKESAPHGVIVGPDSAAWVTDGGLNAIVRVDAKTHAIARFPLPGGRNFANLNTAVFDRTGTLWFTGQDGVYGRLDPEAGQVRVWEAPRGPGPYGITATGAGVFFASLAGNYLGRIDPAAGAATVIDPPTQGAGPRRAWADSRGRVWISEWNAGNVARYEPAGSTWRTWHLPGGHPKAYAVFVDDKDVVWLSDWGANAILRFDPASEQFTSFPCGSAAAEIRQLLGRPGEVWGAESALDRLIMFKTE